MAINYPLVTPAIPGIQKIKLSGVTQASMSQSPFSGGQQIFEWPAEWWLADVSLPPMTRVSAEPWNSFLLALRGKSGTFLLGDSGAKAPQGFLNTSGYPDLLRFTQAFDNAAWTRAAQGTTTPPTVTANAVNDPNGSLTADAINYNTNTGGGVGQIFQAVGPVPLTNRTFTFSIYLRVASGTAPITISISDINFQGQSQVVTVTTTWTRFSVTITFANPPTSQTLAAGPNYAGASSQVVYAWGAQIDRGSVALAYSGMNNNNGPHVNGGSQTGKTLAISFVSSVGLENKTVLKAGDYIQLGTGTAQRLYKTVTDTVTDGSANATLDIFPRLRESPADQTPIYWYDTRGLFRLASNQRDWDIDEALIYGVQFQAMEAF